MLPAIRKTDPWMIISVMLAQLKQSRVYIQTIKEWCEFLGVEAGTPGSSRALLRADQMHAAAYKEWLKGRPGMKDRTGKARPLSSNTIATKLHVMRSVYKALNRAGMLAYNPFDGVRIPKKDEFQKLPTEIIPFEKVGEILEAPDPETFKGRMWRALLAVFFGSGLRLDEARNLRINDFRKTAAGNFYLQLRETKAQKAEDQVLAPWAAKELQQFIEERRIQCTDPDAFVFISCHGDLDGLEPISVSTIQRNFKRYCADVGVMDCSVHSARATFATKLREDGHDLDDVRRALRHRSIITTQKYDKRRISVDRSVGKSIRYE